MDAGQYYITTLSNALGKLGPLIFYLLAGYFLFIKLPFLLYYRTLKKPQMDETPRPEVDKDFQKRMEEERKREFTERMKNLGGKKQDQNKTEDKTQYQQSSQQKSEKRKESKKDNSQPNEAIRATPEEILFKLKPGQLFSAQDLKKRYHQLLKENHPDKFRTDHQKEYAEAKTKTINEAYQKLKKRVS